MLHLAGWGGELFRPFITNRILKFKIERNDTPESLAKKYILSKSPIAISDYYRSGIFLEKKLAISFAKWWHMGERYSAEKTFSEYYVRSHDDFFKDCSFSLAGWAPLLSKKLYALFIKNVNMPDSAKIFFDLTKYLCPEISEYSYDLDISNIERTAIFNKRLMCPNVQLIVPTEQSSEYLQAVEKAKSIKITIDGRRINDDDLPTFELYKIAYGRSISYLNYLVANTSIGDLAPDILNYLNDIKSKKDWKQLSSVYKKLGTAAIALSLNECDDLPPLCKFNKLIID